MSESDSVPSGFAAIEVDRLVLSGADRVKFLHGFCTADIKRMQPGELREAFILNTKGKLVGHVQVLCAAESLELITWPGQASGLQQHLDRYLIREQVAFRTAADQPAIFLTEKAGGLANFIPPLPPGRWAEVSLPGGPMQLGHGEFCGPGWLLLPLPGDPPADLAPLTRWLGEEVGLASISPEALEWYRIAHRYPQFGVDADTETLPQELQRDQAAISFDKGCYLGQETVARIDALGHVNRLLVKLRLESGELPPLPATLTQGDQQVGKLTSTATAESRVIGLGLIKRAAARPGVQLNSGPAQLWVE